MRGARFHPLVLLRDCNRDGRLNLGSDPRRNEGRTLRQDHLLISAGGDLLRTAIFFLCYIWVQDDLGTVDVPDVRLWSGLRYLFDRWLLLLLQCNHLFLILFDVKHVIAQEVTLFPLRSRRLHVVGLHIGGRDRLLSLRLDDRSSRCLFLLRGNHLLGLWGLRGNCNLLLCFLQLLIVLLVSLDVVGLLELLLVFIFQKASCCLLQTLLLFLCLSLWLLRLRLSLLRLLWLGRPQI